ncbi:MAG: hypothetical protein JWM80_4967 [Cyanobacteria bacterium RYN_339]|nr:hypothetical protein [Cyanobacteria bacterium RYN_339]
MYDSTTMQKPVVDLGGSKSVMFSIEAEALKALRAAGMEAEAGQMLERLRRPDLSRFQFLKIVQEYVELK